MMAEEDSSDDENEYSLFCKSHRLREDFYQIDGDLGGDSHPVIETMEQTQCDD